MNANAIREAKALAKRFSPDFNAHTREADLVQNQISHMQILLKELFGVEAEARQTLEARLREAQSRYKTLENESKRLQRIKKIGGIYQRLCLEPLTWRDEKGFPMLVVFALAHPTFRLAAMPGNENSIVEPALPDNISKQYLDVLQLLATHRPKRQGLELTCRFEGLIPREVRAQIKKAQETFGNHVFIVAEPGHFVFNKITPLPHGDPLIVGYDESTDPDGLWLIADFDMTTVEQAMTIQLNNGQN